MAQPDVCPPTAAIDLSFQKDPHAVDENTIDMISPNSPGTTAGHDGASVHVLSGPEVEFPGLPPLLRGHPDVHLRAGIINAFSDTQPNAERAFFAADLSQVYAQHERWRLNLPDIEPFFGT